MSAPDPLANLYAHADQLLTIHEALLRDRVRNRAFYRALKKSVTPGCRVLDIGSGTGLWAVAAAKLGADRVVAVERDAFLIGLIRSLAKENGVADRVEVIEADSRQLTLSREFDVVVSETIGHLIADEQVISIMIDARERFLKMGGALIPEAVALRVAPARLRHRYSHLPAGLQVASGPFESLLLHSPVERGEHVRAKPVAPAADLIRVDLTRATESPPVADLTASWGNLNTRRVNCFLVWAEAILAKGIELATPDTTSWSTTAYRIRPFRCTRGDVSFRLTLTPETNSWIATLDAGGVQEAQSYSPSLAAAALLASARTDINLFGN